MWFFNGFGKKRIDEYLCAARRYSESVAASFSSEELLNEEKMLSVTFLDWKNDRRQPETR